MSSRLKVDVHLHVYPSAQEGQRWKSDYEIWEYGEHSGVRFSPDGGTLPETLAALERADISHGVALNLFSADMLRRDFAWTLPYAAGSAERSAALAEFDDALPDRYVAHNQWLINSLADVPAISGFITVDPWIVSPERNAAHVREMAERGARGLKLHPVLQKFQVTDRRMHSVYHECSDLGLTLLCHTGPAQDGRPLAEASAFVPLLQEFPNLTVVLAHLGGGDWRNTPAFAEAFPNVAFDLCEIIEWLGAPNAPNAEQFARLIREIGPGRVLLGSDYPWYEPAHTAALVESLPILSPAEKNAIMGENAASILGLPV